MYLVSRIHIYLQYYRCALLFASSLLLSRTRLEVASRIRLGQVECERATSTKGELINSRLYRLTLPLTGALRWTLQTLRFLFPPSLSLLVLAVSCVCFCAVRLSVLQAEPVGLLPAAALCIRPWIVCLVLLA